MQGVLLFLFALIAVSCARSLQEDNGGGCCFYRQEGFQDLIRCTSEPFTIAELTPNGKKSEGIRSFFCTDTYSASIQGANGKIEELVDCGDVVNVTTSPIPTWSVAVGECLQRRCCFYTGRNKDGDEYCVNADGAPVDELPRVQANGKFVVAECLAEWSSTVHVTGGNSPVINIGCGETFDIPSAASLTITRIETSPCPVGDFADDVEDDNSQAVAEAVEDTYVEQSWGGAVGDASVDAAVGDAEFAEAFDEQYVDQSVDQLAVDQFADQAVSDTYVEDTNADQFADQAVSDTYVEDTNVDQFADQFADQAVSDTYVEDTNADQFADQAVSDAYVEDTNTDQFVQAEYFDAAVVDEVADQDVFSADVPTVTEQAVYEMESDFVADGNYDAAFSDASFSVDQSVDLAVADFNDIDQASADQFVDESFSDADQLNDQYDNY
jgi:hypothetical protein